MTPVSSVIFSFDWLGGGALIGKDFRATCAGEVSNYTVIFGRHTALIWKKENLASATEQKFLNQSMSDLLGSILRKVVGYREFVYVFS